MTFTICGSSFPPRQSGNWPTAGLPGPDLLTVLDRTETPPALHPHYGSVAELPGRLFVAHARPRMEKLLAFDLLDRGIPYFLPLGRYARYSGRKRYYAHEPVFKQYIFIASDADSADSLGDTMARCMGTHRVCRNIEVKAQTQLRHELGNLETALGACPEIEQCPLVKGQRVRIVEGPFRNLEGVILERELSAVLVLQVAGMCASMEIPRVMVEPA